jgi:Group II intron, maturase-specific domain
VPEDLKLAALGLAAGFYNWVTNGQKEVSSAQVGSYRLQYVGFDFLGFHIRWRRKRGTSKWYVYTYVAQRPIRSMRDKIRALTLRTSQQDLGTVLIRINQITRGWNQLFQTRRCETHLPATSGSSPGGGSCR